MQNDKEITDKVALAAGNLYRNLTERLTSEERQKLNDSIKQQTADTTVLGSEVKKAIFNYVCPDTNSLIAASGFNTHGNVNATTGEVEAILTVECRACKKEHPITVISFPEMLSMPIFESIKNKN